MSEPDLEAGRLDRAIERVAFAVAIAGGAALVAVVLLTALSVAGRNLSVLGLGPIPGDYELVEVLTAFAVFASLGWCQLRRGHVRVELFWRQPPGRLARYLDVAVDAAMTAAATLLTWRLALGLGDRVRYGETTFVLQLPLAWAYAACLVGAAVFVLAAGISLRRSWRRANER